MTLPACLWGRTAPVTALCHSRHFGASVRAWRAYSRPVPAGSLCGRLLGTVQALACGVCVTQPRSHGGNQQEPVLVR